MALVCRVCTYTTFFQRKKFLVQNSFFFNSTPPISVHCFFPIAACPAILALLQKSSYENRGTEWSKIRVFGMLQRVRAGRDLPVDWLNIYGEGDGEACLGEMQNAPTRAPRRRLGVSEKYCSLSHPLLCKCPYSIRPASVHTMLLALCLLFTHDPVVLQLFLYLLLHTQRCYQSEG